MTLTYTHQHSYPVPPLQHFNTPSQLHPSISPGLLPYYDTYRTLLSCITSATLNCFHKHLTKHHYNTAHDILLQYYCCKYLRTLLPQHCLWNTSCTQVSQHYLQYFKCLPSLLPQHSSSVVSTVASLLLV